jgi:hypothetical protein
MGHVKAHFIASTGHLRADIDNYHLILNALKSANVELTSNWLDKAYERMQTGISRKSDGENWGVIYRENVEAISKADVILAEVSKSSFLVGFQVACGLQLKKPVLLLSTHEKADGALGVSLNEEIIKFARYDKENISQIIKDFVEENRLGTKDIRFNFFIDRKILNYLNWASLNTGETKSEIIRNLLEQEIERTKD